MGTAKAPHAPLLFPHTHGQQEPEGPPAHIHHVADAGNSPRASGGCAQPPSRWALDYRPLDFKVILMATDMHAAHQRRGRPRLLVGHPSVGGWSPKDRAQSRPPMGDRQNGSTPQEQLTGNGGDLSVAFRDSNSFESWMCMLLCELDPLPRIGGLSWLIC